MSDLGGEQVEGRHAVLELLRAGRRSVRSVQVSRAADDDVIDEIVQLAGPRLRRVAADRIRTLAKSETHQGVVALAEPLRPVDVDDLLARPDAFVLALDGVTDPHNLGAILRSAETAGVSGVVLPRHRSARVTPVVAKAAAGAIEYVPIALVSGIPSVLERAARAGVWTVGLDEHGEQSLFDLSLADQAIAIVLGAEGRGLAQLTRKRCDVLVRIPMQGHLASLNVSAAAALACHEVARRRRGAGPT